MALVRSIAFSLLASIAATVIARRMLSVSSPTETRDGAGSSGMQTVVIVVPVLVGNSNNRIGWVKETHHHHRPLFGLGRD